MRAFVDTNGEKTAKAIILLEQYPVISTQVINEAISVLTRKCGVSRQNAYELADLWLDACEVESVTVSTIRQAMLLTQKHMLSHWDALIVAASLLAKCDILYSEDMQHGYVFDNCLRVVNPFLVAI